MDLFAVSGASDNVDGFLYVVQAVDENDAKQRVAEKTGLKLCTLKDEDGVEFEALVDPNDDPDDIYVECGVPSNGFVIYVGMVDPNGKANGAVHW